MGKWTQILSPTIILVAIALMLILDRYDRQMLTATQDYYNAAHAISDKRSTDHESITEMLQIDWQQVCQTYNERHQERESLDRLYIHNLQDFSYQQSMMAKKTCWSF